MAVYTIQVLDNATGQPIPGGKVSFYADLSKSDPLLAEFPVDSTGTMTFDSDDYPVFLLSSTTVRATAPGYADLGITGDALAQSWYFKLVKNPASNTLLYVGLGVGATLLAVHLFKKGNRRVGAAAAAPREKTDYSKWIIPIGAVGLGYFVLKSITNTLGLTETADQKAQREASQAALTNAANSSYAITPPTQSDAVWSAAADSIYSDLSGSLPLLNFNSPSDAADILDTAQNTSDVLKIIQFFGTRSQTLFGIPGPNMTLPQFVRSGTGSFSNDRIDALNQSYAAKGINWKW